MAKSYNRMKRKKINPFLLPFIWVADLALTIFVMIPFALCVYAFVNVAFWGMDIYKLVKR